MYKHFRTAAEKIFTFNLDFTIDIYA